MAAFSGSVPVKLCALTGAAPAALGRPSTTTPRATAAPPWRTARRLTGRSMPTDDDASSPHIPAPRRPRHTSAPHGGTGPSLRPGSSDPAAFRSAARPRPQRVETVTVNFGVWAICRVGPTSRASTGL